MNLAELFKATSLDVFEAMTYLGFATNQDYTPINYLVVDDLSEYNTNTPQAQAGFDVEARTVVLPKNLLSDPEQLWCSVCHELTHAHQPVESILRDQFLPYYFQEIEKQAYIVQAYLYGKLIAGKTISKLTHDNILAKLEYEWLKLRITSLSN